MPITAVSSASLSPAHTAPVKAPTAQRTVTAAPFTPTAQKQANAINAGQSPHRGKVVDIKA